MSHFPLILLVSCLFAEETEAVSRQQQQKQQQHSSKQQQQQQHYEKIWKPGLQCASIAAMDSKITVVFACTKMFGISRFLFSRRGGFPTFHLSRFLNSWRLRPLATVAKRENKNSYFYFLFLLFRKKCSLRGVKTGKSKSSCFSWSKNSFEK